ncbi:hypothetical protein PCANB_002341 [Pneumocystis canis]|nr:hypothetical protein PCANB_002341 [Pneumocystis canis]
MLNILLSQLLKINDPINQIYILSQIRQLIINNQDSKSFFRECKGFEKILFFLYSKFLNNLIKNTQQKTIQKDFFQQSNQVICSVLTLLSTAVSWDPFNTHHFFHYCDISSFIFKATFLQDEPETLLGILFSFALNDESLQSSFKSIKEKLALEDHTQKELKKYTFNKLKKLIKDFFSEKDTIVNPKILPLILSVQENLKSSWHRLSVFLIFISLLGNCISETNLIAFTNNEIPSIIIKRLFGNDSIISDHLERKLALKLIIKLCQNGLPTKDIFFLIQKFSEDLTKNRELASFLLHLFSQNQNPSHIQFNLSLHGYSYIEFSSLYKPFPPLEYYSMFFWVRFDMFDETLDTNILGIIDNRKKYICKLVIEKHSKHLLFQTSLENHTKFSFYKFKENQWYHIVLVHQKSKDIVSSNLSLFVNGQHIENIICPYPLINKENSFIQLFLGTPQELCAHYGQNKSLLKWSLSSFLIIEDILSENIIKLYYCLGPYYNNIYQKSSNNSVINSLELLNILLEKKAHCEEEKNVFISMIKGRNFTSTLYDKMLFYISNDSILNINSFSNWDDSGKINKKIIQTINKKINNDLVIFNKASPFSSYYITDQKRIGWFLGNPINVIVNNVQDSIYYIGGPILGLKLIENSKTPNDVICTTKLILSFIKNNKKNLEDMEKNYGYKILAKILKSKEKKALNVQLLNSILSFLGYDKIDPKYLMFKIKFI